MTFGNVLQPGREAKWPGLFCATLLGLPGGNPGNQPLGVVGHGGAPAGLSNNQRWFIGGPE